MKAPKRLKRLTFNQLDHWFETADPIPPIQSLSTMDGFLAGVIAGPEPIPPEVWMRRIIGDHENHAFIGTKTQAVIDTIIARYDEISTGLAKSHREYGPFFLKTEDGEIIVDEWANGFCTAMRLNMPAWAPIMVTVDDAAPLMAIMMHATTPDGNAALDTGSIGIPEEFIEEAKWLIPEAVVKIRNFFQSLKSNT